MQNAQGEADLLQHADLHQVAAGQRAARTSTFFSHCRGRTALIRPDSVVIGLCTGDSGVAAGGEVVVTGAPFPG